MRGIGKGQTIKLVLVPEILGLVKTHCSEQAVGVGLEDVIIWLLSNSMANEKIASVTLCQQEVQSWDATLRMQLQPGTCQFPVLRFWGKMTMPNAGTIAHRWDFPSTTRI